MKLSHPNRLSRKASLSKKRGRETRSRRSIRQERKVQQIRSEECVKLSFTARLMWAIWEDWAARKLAELRKQYYQFWWFVVFRGRSLDRIIQVLERLRRSKLRMAERIKLGLPRPRLRRRWGRNYHHLVPKSRGGRAKPQNLMLTRLDRHVGWHILFKDERGRDMTLSEVIAMLIAWRQTSLAK